MAKSPRRWAIAPAALLILVSMPLAAGAQEPLCGEGIAVPLPAGGVGCSHGDDPVPEGAVPFEQRTMAPLAAPSGVTCVADGVEGSRVQPLYVVAADRPNRSSSIVPRIEQWVGEVDSIFSNSSNGSGADLVVRWVHDSGCVPAVETVVIPAAADDSFAATIAALDAAGYGEPGRHYLAWVDDNRYCGIAVNYRDDSPGENNNHNGAYPLWGRIDTDCWGIGGMVEAHELSHMLGAVQGSAPHSTEYGHCTDENDVMCYVDGPGVTMSTVCEAAEASYLLDCNHDDYFDPSPDKGSYLDTHWNIARSSFLHDRSGASQPPRTDPAPTIGFFDVDTAHPFASEIAWLAASGITKGCNPPANDEFCPDDPVTRSQMAAFLARALELPAPGSDHFTDDDGSVFEADVNRLADAGITTGCGGGRYCLDEPLTRGQMAAFLERSLPHAA